MNKFTAALIILLSMFSTTTVIAADQKKPASAPKVIKTETQSPTSNDAEIKAPTEFQQVIDDYKSYVSKIPASVRDEVIAYRREIAKINKEKRSLYKQLSQESQDYLKNEQEYKKKLPLGKKGLINVETPGEKTAKDDNNK